MRVRIVSWEPELRGWQMSGECRLRHRGQGVWTDERKQRERAKADLGRDEQGVDGGETETQQEEAAYLSQTER